MWICQSILTFVLSGYYMAGIEASQPNIVFVMADDLGKYLISLIGRVFFLFSLTFTKKYVRL